MIHFIEKYYSVITWTLVLLAIGSFFYDGIRSSYVLGLYFLIEFIKERKAIMKYFHQLSFKEYVVHLCSFIILVAMLTPITIYSLKLLDRINSPTWFIYVYLFFLLNISTFLFIHFLHNQNKK